MPMVAKWTLSLISLPSLLPTRLCEMHQFHQIQLYPPHNRQVQCRTQTGSLEGHLNALTTDDEVWIGMIEKDLSYLSSSRTFTANQHAVENECVEGGD